MIKTLNHYILLGLKIQEADTKYIGDDWQLPTWLKTVHDVTHMAVKNTRDLALHNERKKTQQMLNSKIETEFVHSQIANLRQLNLPQSLRYDIDLYVSTSAKLKKTGTAEQIRANRRFAKKNERLSETAKEMVLKEGSKSQNALNLYKKIVERIENYLHANLPYWKYDERLLNFGFKPAYYTSDAPTELEIKNISID